jgi:hypothetical protein
MKKISALFLVLLFVLGAVPANVPGQLKAKTGKTAGTAPARPAFGNTEGITAEQMRNHLEFIASDELEGRDTPSRGLDIAAIYIAQHLKRWGIKPAGDNGTYFQRFPLKRNKVDAQNTRLELNGQKFIYGDDFLTNYNAGSISGANVVYVGHGWMIKAKNIDAHQGLDVKDKIVVAYNSLPKGMTFNDLQGGKQGVDRASPTL